MEEKVQLIGESWYNHSYDVALFPVRLDVICGTCGWNITKILISVAPVDKTLQKPWCYLWHLWIKRHNKIDFNTQYSQDLNNGIQWGSETWPFKIWKHLKSRLFEGRISNGQVFKCQIVKARCFNYGYSYGPNHLRTRCFCHESKWADNSILKYMLAHALHEIWPRLVRTYLR